MSWFLRAARYVCPAVLVIFFLILPISSNAQSRITNVSDITGDGKSDLLWYNPATRQFAVWLMDGTAQAGSSYLPVGTNWKIAATADFNGDGKADLLWYDASTGQY